jgi:hypothetical protein
MAIARRKQTLLPKGDVEGMLPSFFQRLNYRGTGLPENNLAHSFTVRLTTILAE